MNFKEYGDEFISSDLEWEAVYDFEISDLITTARLYSGFTQEKLAQAAGMQQPGVARAESGASLASHNLLKRVARAIGTTLLPPRFGFMDEPETITENISFVPDSKNDHEVWQVYSGRNTISNPAGVSLNTDSLSYKERPILINA